ncbi:MAG: hypothetical protein AVDCRST_MAG95-3674 [uncultured Adhaeribacter sp.]|uniref:Uncharacterized protein n=1 Tax=uncultured Adhaeribacter sp. TaxID=448109 RepID=A0A6J4JSK7_9BACT|nr:MAG: hypothetical protein AVDCRST_MAG95-3674 [uncultured Adhaeribacter sp.]
MAAATIRSSSTGLQSAWHPNPDYLVMGLRFTHGIGPPVTFPYR